MLTNTEELQLTEAEAHNLAERTACVARHYDIRTTQKAADWGALFVAIGAVYIPRAIIIRNNRQQRQTAMPESNGVPNGTGRTIDPNNLDVIIQGATEH